MTIAILILSVALLLAYICELARGYVERRWPDDEGDT